LIIDNEHVPRASIILSRLQAEANITSMWNSSPICADCSLMITGV